MDERPRKPKDDDSDEGFDTGFGEEGTLEIPVHREGNQPGKPSDSSSNLSSGFGEESTEVIPQPGIAPHARLFREAAPASEKAAPFREQQTEEMPVYSSREPQRAARSTPKSSAPAKGSAARGLLTVLLFTWASIATVLAAWLWLKWPETPGALETLPDDGALQGQITSPVEELSSRQLVRFGESKTVGWLRVTPLWIESRPVTVLPERIVTEPVLVLYLRLTNVSESESFIPADPAFLYPLNGKKLAGLPMFNSTGYTYSFLHPPEQPHKLILPFDLPYTLGQTIEGQEFPELKPGESADLVVISSEDAYQQLSDRMVWRVKLRKGKTADGRGLATVIGVPFRKVDITAISKDPLVPAKSSKS